MEHDARCFVKMIAYRRDLKQRGYVFHSILQSALNSSTFLASLSPATFLLNIWLHRKSQPWIIYAQEILSPLATLASYHRSVRPMSLAVHRKFALSPDLRKAQPPWRRHKGR